MRSPAEFHFETSVASVTIKKGDVPERTVKIVMEDGRSLDLTMDEARALVSQLQRLHGYNGPTADQKSDYRSSSGPRCLRCLLHRISRSSRGPSVRRTFDYLFLRTLRHRAAILKQQLSKAEASTLDDLVEVLETMAGSVDLC